MPASLEDALRRAAVEHTGVTLAVLFGSRARGDAHARSDVDVGILLASDPVSERGAVEAAFSRAGRGALDIVFLRDAPPQLRFEIARDGRVLFERVPYAWADFRARAMIDWWDWAPTARMIHTVAAARLRRQVTNGST